MREYVLLETLLPKVLRDCPNVPRDVALHDIRQAAIKFCSKTRMWREDLVPQQTVADATVTEYEIFTLAPGSRPVAILSIQADGIPLEPKTEDELDRGESNWRAIEGMPSKFTAPSASWIRPIPIASSKVVTITGKVAVAPQQDGLYLLDDIAEIYGEAIASIAKGTLMMIPGKPWTNSELAVFHIGLGESAMSEATAHASRNFSAAPKRRVKPVWY